MTSRQEMERRVDVLLNRAIVTVTWVRWLVLWGALVAAGYGVTEGRALNLTQTDRGILAYACLVWVIWFVWNQCVSRKREAMLCLANGVLCGWATCAGLG